MSDKSNDLNGQAGLGAGESKPTRRSVLAAGGAVALSGLAGCAAIDGLLERGTEQLVGTTVSSPATFYPGRLPSDQDSDDDGLSDGDEPQFFVGGDTEVREVPATVRAEGQEIDLEGWAVSTSAKDEDYNSPRSNRSEYDGDNTPVIQGARSVWWAGPDDDGDDDGDGYGDLLVAIQAVELDLLAETASAASSISKRSARTGRIAAMDDSIQEVRSTAERCSEGVCKTVLETTDDRERLIGQVQEHIEVEEWDQAAAAADEIRDITEENIGRLDDELEARRPGRPRFSDIVAYLDGEPTIGERFTVCLPDAKLPGDRGSLAEELTPGRVLSYFAPSREPDGVRAPFNDQYGDDGISYDEDGCIQIDGPLSLHEDLACQNVLSADLDTYRTANRGIVGYSTDAGAVVSGALESADTDGKCVFVAADGTLQEASSNGRPIIIGGNPGSYWGQERSAGVASVSPTLVCPVTVTPEDSPIPLPGLFYVRRIIHDDQLIFAGGWILDDGALFEDSVTLLFDEGPTEVASVTLEDIESDDSNDRIVGQFSRDRSELGSLVGSAQVEGTDMNKAELIEAMASAAFQTEQGRKGLNAVNVKVLGEQGGGDDDDDSDNPIQTTVAALDAPLVHLAGAGKLSAEQKRKGASEKGFGFIVPEQ